MINLTVSLEAEDAVIGGLMLDNRVWDEVAMLVEEDDFTRAQNRMVFRTMSVLALQRIPFDIVTLSEVMEREGTLEHAGGMEWLGTLAKDTPSTANILTYAKIVHERAQRRRSKSLLIETLDLIDRDEDAIDTLLTRLMSVNEDRHVTDNSMEDAVAEAIQRIDDAMNRGEFAGLKTGVGTLDKALGGGYYNGDLIVIGARPKMGKTSLLLDGIMRAALDKLPVGVISTEQPKHQIAERFIAKKTGIPVSKMRAGDLTQDEFKMVFEAAQVVRLLPIRTSDIPKPTISNVARIGRQWKKQYGIRGLFVDYIQRLRGDDPRAERATQTGVVAAGLKTIARDLDIPVIALSQVNRQVDSRTNKRPGLADFAWSSDIEAEADAAVTIYRDEVYNENTLKRGEAELGVVASRHGAAGTAYCTFRGEYMSFADKSMREPKDAPAEPHWLDGTDK